MSTDKSGSPPEGWPEHAACLHELFEAQVAATPDAVAVVSLNQHLSYAELNHRANRLAHHLMSTGVGPESVVGVHLRRGVDLVVALLAVLKAGGAYLPLDPDQPAERLGSLVAGSATHVVLTSAWLPPAPADPRDGVVYVERDLTGESGQNPSSGVVAANPACVVYASGSTGRGTGLAVEHREIVDRLRWMQDTYRLDRTDRVLQKSPFGIDASVWELFCPLLAGAAVVLARPGGHRDPGYLADITARQRITTIHFVPSMLRAYLAELPGSGAEVPSLRRIVCSGAPAPAELAAEVQRRLGCPLHYLGSDSSDSSDTIDGEALPDPNGHRRDHAAPWRGGPALPPTMPLRLG